MKKRKNTLLRPLCAFLLTLLLAGMMTGYVQYNQSAQEREQMAYLAQTISSETYEIMLSQMSKTRVLEAYLMETGGVIGDFSEIAQVLLQEGYVRNVLFAPGGVVSAVYPLENNESVIGLDMRSDGAGNREAQAAIEKGELYIAGPFGLVQGGVGIAGRLPVYLPDETGASYFWGIVSVTLEYPAVLESGSLSSMDSHGFAGELWRINPDTGSRQTIFATRQPLPAGTSRLEQPFTLFNSTWTITLASLRPWYTRGSFLLCAAISLLVSVLAAVVVGFMGKMRLVKQEESQRQISDLRRQLESEQTNMLLSQISSHFFYHTLNSLQALIVLQPDAAYKMAGDFSRYLRFNVDSITAAGGIGGFKQELRAVRAYVDINQQQLGERLRVSYAVADVDFDIPVLSLQPIVENAIIHGIKPKIGGGSVEISLREDEDFFVVTVSDDGIGFDAQALPSGQSVGLSNVQKRISQFAGCSMQIQSQPGSGTTVTLSYAKILRTQ